MTSAMAGGQYVIPNFLVGNEAPHLLRCIDEVSPAPIEHLLASVTTPSGESRVISETPGVVVRRDWRPRFGNNQPHLREGVSGRDFLRTVASWPAFGQTARRIPNSGPILWNSLPAWLARKDILNLSSRCRWQRWKVVQKHGRTPLGYSHKKQQRALSVPTKGFRCFPWCPMV